MAKNAKIKLRDDGILVIKIDTNKKGTVSSTGKTVIIAQQEGRFESLTEAGLEGWNLNLMVLKPHKVKPKVKELGKKKKKKAK